MRHIMDEKRTNRKKRNLVRLIVRSLMVIVVFVALGLLGAFVALADFAIYNVVDLLTWFVKGGK